MKRVYPKSVVHGKPILGAIPSGWRRVQFSEILQVVERPAKLNDDVLYNLVTVKRNRGGVCKRSKLLGKHVKTKTQFIIKNDDFLISRRQIVHGACGVVPKDLDGSIVSNEYSILHPKPGLDLTFLQYLTHTPHFQKTCFHSSIGVHVEKMVFKIEQWLKYKIDIPSLSEQHAIAELLTVWDTGISNVENLISNKKKLKKGLMQQYLSGAHRYPDFDDTWREVRLGDVFTNRLEKNHVTLPLIAITGENGVIDRNELVRKDTSNEDKSKYLRICPGDIGYNTMRMWQGVSGLSTIEGIVSPAYTIITPDNSIYPDFMALFFKYPPIIYLFYRFSQGMVNDTLNLKYSNFSKIKVKLPSIKEQMAITSIFKPIDKEIDLLLKKLALLKNQKKGLMQQLLTGKKRIPITEAE